MRKRPCKKCGAEAYGKLCRDCYCIRIARKKVKAFGFKVIKIKKKYKIQKPQEIIAGEKYGF